MCSPMDNMPIMPVEIVQLFLIFYMWQVAEA